MFQVAALVCLLLVPQQSKSKTGPVLLPPDAQSKSATPKPAAPAKPKTDRDSELETIRSKKRSPKKVATESPLASAAKSDEMRKLIRNMVLENIPHQYEDLKNWNKTKEVVSGLNVKLDGLRLRTKRRRKKVNHGSWKRYNVELLNPDQEFDFKIENMKSVGAGEVTFRASVVTPLKIIARLQEWSFGARLMSVSTEAESRVRLHVDCRVAFELDGKKFPPDVVIRPKVSNADIQLVDFEVKRISHLKGSVAREIGRSMRRIIDSQIEKKRQKLPSKINKQIAKKQDRLRLSLSDMLNSKWGKAVNPLGKTKPKSDS